MSHRPDPAPPRLGRRVVILVILGTLIATLFSIIAANSQPEHIPMDSGTPATVTTIGR